MDSGVPAGDQHGFRYFYELIVGSIVAVFVAFQTWVAAVQFSHSRKIARLEAAQLTREDFDRWKEEQQLQLDELRASTIASNHACVAAVERSQEKLEASLTRGLDRVESTNRELLVALAKQGLQSGMDIR